MNFTALCRIVFENIFKQVLKLEILGTVAPNRIFYELIRINNIRDFSVILKQLNGVCKILLNFLTCASRT
jgi:hypothetical protein